MHNRRSRLSGGEPAGAASLVDQIQQQALRVGSDLLGLLFPSRCVSCQRVDEVLCLDCRMGFAAVAPPICERCGQPVDDQTALCWYCRAQEPPYEVCRSVFRFEGTLRAAVVGFKFEGRTDTGSLLVQEMIEALRQQHPEHETWPLDVVVPVPLHPAREQARGYNQARLLAEPLAEAWGLPVSSNESLRRVRDTRSQLGLNAQERQANVRDAFRASEEQVAGLNVLLLDDVRTTGATLEASSTALMDAGARVVYVLTLAQAT